MQKNIIKELIIRCPYSGRDVNIAPMLYTLANNDSPRELASQLEEFIDNTVSFAKDLLELNSAEFGYKVALLAELKKALRCMTPGEYNSTDLHRVFQC